MPNAAELIKMRAELDLEKARLQAARVQDLPENTMARREAELEYDEAQHRLESLEE